MIKAKCLERGRLDGKTAIVTGANSGVGKETVAELARRGASVIMACRNRQRAVEARDDIMERYGEDSDTALTLNIGKPFLEDDITPVRWKQVSDMINQVG